MNKSKFVLCGIVCGISMLTQNVNASSGSVQDKLKRLVGEKVYNAAHLNAQTTPVKERVTTSIRTSISPNYKQAVERLTKELSDLKTRANSLLASLNTKESQITEQGATIEEMRLIQEAFVEEYKKLAENNVNLENSIVLKLSISKYVLSLRDEFIQGLGTEDTKALLYKRCMIEKVALLLCNGVNVEADRLAIEGFNDLYRGALPSTADDFDPISAVELKEETQQGLRALYSKLVDEGLRDQQTQNEVPNQNGLNADSLTILPMTE